MTKFKIRPTTARASIPAKAATDDAQVGLAEMVRAKPPNGKADFGEKAENKGGQEPDAGLGFNEKSEADRR